MKCARECPAKAISTADGPVMYNGYEIWKPDVDACTKFRVLNRNGAGCGRCIKVCPWNKSDTWYHSAARWSAQRSSFARELLIWLDDLLGYGKQVENDKWWFDLEEVDGIIEAR